MYVPGLLLSAFIFLFSAASLMTAGCWLLSATLLLGVGHMAMLILRKCTINFEPLMLFLLQVCGLLAAYCFSNVP
jgi:hypothetical protein